MREFRRLCSTIILLSMLLGGMAVSAESNIVRTPITGKGDIKIDVGIAANQVDQRIDASNSVSQYFKTEYSLLGVSIICPSYHDSIGKISIAVYKWAGSVEQTLKTKAIGNETFVDFADGATLEMNLGHQPAGEYMIHVYGGEQIVGIWLGSKGSVEQKTFLNGEETERALRSKIIVQGEMSLEKNENVHTQPRNAYEVIPAVDFDLQTGITVGNISEADIDETGVDKLIIGKLGSVAGYCKIDFGKVSPKGVKMHLYSGNFVQLQKVQVVLDDPEAYPVAELRYEFDRRYGEWVTLPATITEEITGVHDVYIVTRSDFTDVRLAWFEFTEENPGMSPVEQRLADFNADPEIELVDNYSDTWVATDMLGRKLPGNDKVGDPNPNKEVGMFYWSWHVGASKVDNKPFNVNEAVEKYPNIVHNVHAKEWDNGVTYWWNESIYGFYTNYDNWVTRKQMELLGAAGVDAIFFDTSNGPCLNTSAMNIAKTLHQMHLEGVKTPGISYLFSFFQLDWNAWDIQNVYETMYQSGLYSDCWYYWKGKPLLMAYPDYLKKKTGYEDIDALYEEMYDFFTFRPGQPDYRKGPTRNDQWPWLEVYPQHPYGKSDKYGCECVSVGVAQNTNDRGLTAMNGTDVYGRSFTYTDRFSKLNENSKLYGYNFQEQWDRAFELDPEFVFVTGWNEFQVGRYEVWNGVANGFPDQYNDEYSRDIEPVKGDLKDVYYYLLVSNIRRFKGVRPTPKASEEKVIDIDGDFAQWADVGPEFIGNRGGTENRNMENYGKVRYTNYTGRNDIVLSKVARDSENLYFYVETADELTPHTDKDWMRLFINTDRLSATGWEGYDFVLNNVSPTATKAVIQKHNGGEWNWKDVGELDYKVSGNKMMVKIPKNILGLSGDEVDIEFKWNDNMQIKGDIMDFYINGDTAPIGRFNYHYITGESKTQANESLPIRKTAADLLENHTVMVIDNPVALRDGEIVRIDSDNANISPKIINDKTMVPLRFVTENLGATVSWDDATQTATITKFGKRVKVTVGSDEMRIEKQSVKLQTPAQLIDDRIFVPLRDVSEAFDTQVSWQEPNTVIVGDNAHVLTLENPDVMNLINLNLN